MHKKKQDTELSILQIPLDKDWQINTTSVWLVSLKHQLPMRQSATRETVPDTSQSDTVHQDQVALRQLILAGINRSTTDFVFMLKASYQHMTTLSLSICRIFRHFYNTRAPGI